jgi:hypothetical protein
MGPIFGVTHETRNTLPRITARLKLKWKIKRRVREMKYLGIMRTNIQTVDSP